MRSARILTSMMVAATVALPAAASAPVRVDFSPATNVSGGGFNASDLSVAGSSSGNRAVAVWLRGDTKRVQVATTADAGGTWSLPATLSDAAYEAETPNAAASADARLVAVVWNRRTSPRRAQVAVSSDGASTWNPVQTLDVGPTSTSRPQIAVSADGTRLVMVYEQWDGANYRIYACSSGDGGFTWSSPTIVSAPGISSNYAKVQFAGSRVIASWTAYTTTTVVQAATSPDGGRTWADPESLSLPGRGAGTGSFTASSDGARMAAVWTQETPGGLTVDSAYSLDAGRTWSSPLALIPACDGGSYATSASSADGSTVWAAWANGCSTVTATQVAVSHDTGRTWSPATTLSGVQSALAPIPSITASADGTRATVTWSDDQNAPDTVRASTTIDSGASWTPPQTVTPGQSPLATGSADGSRVIAAFWHSDGMNWRIQSSSARVKTPPSAPVAPTATAGDGQAMIAWSPPASDGGSPVTSYRVSGGAGCSTAGLACTVTGLTPGSHYTFEVVAGNEVGTGPSASVTVTVPTRQQSAQVSLPSRIKLRGRTQLLPSAVITNAGQRATSRVVVKPAKRKWATVKTTKAGRVRITTTGRHKLTVTLTLTAPATAEYCAFTLTKTWKVAKKR